jgi:hypothetical protein
LLSVWAAVTVLLGHWDRTPEGEGPEYTSGAPRRGAVPLARAQHHGHLIGQIHDRGGLHAAVAAVDHQVDLVLEELADLVGVDQRQLVVRA